MRYKVEKIRKLDKCQKFRQFERIPESLKEFSKCFVFDTTNCQKALGSGWVGFGRPEWGRFIVLNDSASPKIIKKMYFNFF